MAPSQLQIATSSLLRLIKEEKSYHTELTNQQTRITALENSLDQPEADDEKGNRAYTLKQERRALDETLAVLPTMRERITSAREKLESLLDSSANSEEELGKARDALRQAKEIQKGDPDSAKPEEVLPVPVQVEAGAK